MKKFFRNLIRRIGLYAFQRLFAAKNVLENIDILLYNCTIHFKRGKL